MIKDKITSEIKDKFRDAIKKTKETGNEYSFYICKDQLGDLSSTSITQGSPRRTEMGPLKCPFKTQGNFHTHPDISNMKKSMAPRIVSDDVARQVAINLAKKQGLPITSPSHPDLLIALLNKCIKRTEGTVCIGSDADPERVDCWTTIGDSRKNCMEALYRFEKEFNPEPPKEWIKPLFEKEIINL